MKGVTVHELEVKREQALAELIESRDADFNDHRVTHSAKTANALARFLLLEELVAAAVDLADQGKGNAKRKGGTPSGDQPLDL
jgi:hypothetical protein